VSRTAASVAASAWNKLSIDNFCHVMSYGVPNVVIALFDHFNDFGLNLRRGVLQHWRATLFPRNRDRR